eukprot:jgi/Chrzof1/2567/Cz11g20180.t1
MKVLLTPRHLGIVMTYEAGGDLHSYCEKYKLNETIARYFFRQVINALSYCHKHHIAHRDLKLANFLLDTNKPPRCDGDGTCNSSLHVDSDGILPDHLTQRVCV